MSRPGSHTTAEPLEWKQAMHLIKKLEQDEPQWCLLVASGIFLTLRISDILCLKWEQLIGERLSLIEKKTGKQRTININSTLRELATRLREDRTGYIFLNKRKEIYSRQYCNIKLHEFAVKYKLPDNFTSHGLRKTGGKRIYEANGESERALVILSEILNHSSLKTTKVYIGVRQKEYEDVYLHM